MRSRRLSGGEEATVPARPHGPHAEEDEGLEHGLGRGDGQVAGLEGGARRDLALCHARQEQEQGTRSTWLIIFNFVCILQLTYIYCEYFTSPTGVGAKGVEEFPRNGGEQPAVAQVRQEAAEVL